jgi:serine/threonine protein phosphatase 1
LLWYNHGGEATVNAYKTVDTDTKLRHIEFLATLKDYYLDDKNRLFVHAGFTNMNGVNTSFILIILLGSNFMETALSLDQALNLMICSTLKD